MHVFFEDDGAFKAGTVLADSDSSLQVEVVSGKRLKVKATNVLLRYQDPSPSGLLAEAQALAAELDPNFLWEVSGDNEFGFTELANEYFGHIARPAEAAALALCLHRSPMHFYKKGRGRYRPAPPDALKSALAGVERKKRESERVTHYVTALKAGELPEGFRPILPALLYRPDKNALETRALISACEELQISQIELLSRCGAVPSTHDFHYNRFLFETFPRASDFQVCTDEACFDPLTLPLASVSAFSIDDATTTEIDDAFSVQRLADGKVRIGIHIAAPAVGIPRGSALDGVARSRLSTVYMPGRKLTMLPESVVDRFTLAAGRECPALSLYIHSAADGTPLEYETRLERVAIAANLRLDAISDAFADQAFESADPPKELYQSELAVLYRVALALEAQRGKTEVQRVDYGFLVDWSVPGGRISIEPRLRGSPLDKVVAELMIQANTVWGKTLADAGIAGLYRTQLGGKVKMSTRPEPHQGLGVPQYLWASSPLRRYSDLFNQRQLLAAVEGTRAPYADRDPELYSAMADFEITYAAYAEFQSVMEHYWCLRWLLQEEVTELEASVIRDNLVRTTRLPMVLKVPDLPGNLSAGTAVRIEVGRIDLLALTMESRYVAVVPGCGKASV